jgi:hypothetical protein
MNFRCVGFDLSPRRPQAWTRCKRRAAREDRFCPIHRGGLDGAILGLMQWEQRLKGADRENEAYIMPAQEPVCKTCGARRKWKMPAKTAARRILGRRKKNSIEEAERGTGERDAASTDRVDLTDRTARSAEGN